MPLRIAEPPPLETSPINWRREVQKWAPRSSGRASSQNFVWRTGYPYDSIELVEPIGAQRSSSTRTGVVRYANGGFIPDLYFATAATDWGVGLWGYAGQSAEINYYVQLPESQDYGAVQLWNKGGTWTEMTLNQRDGFFYAFADDKAQNVMLAATGIRGQSRLALWDNGASSYGSLYTTSGQTDLHMYSGNGTHTAYLSANSNSDAVSLDLVAGTQRGIRVSTSDMNGEGTIPESLYAMFRLVENCEGKRAFVLMTDWFSEPEGGNNGGGSSGNNTVQPPGGGEGAEIETVTEPPATYIPGGEFVAIKP